MSQRRILQLSNAKKQQCPGFCNISKYIYPVLWIEELIFYFFLNSLENPSIAIAVKAPASSATVSTIGVLHSPIATK